MRQRWTFADGNWANLWRGKRHILNVNFKDVNSEEAEEIIRRMEKAKDPIGVLRRLNRKLSLAIKEAEY